jgi:ATP-dependent DNA helicase RecG
MNAIIHRDYFFGNAPIKFYEYKKNRIEISNPGGLFGRANPDNFPFVNDYRNPLLAEAMKVLGMVNKYNRGIAKANKELEKNGNLPAKFDVNKFTEFRVTIVSNEKSGTMNGESGTMIVKKWHYGREHNNSVKEM